MKTISQISRQTGISIRALRHYDAMGLLKPTAFTEGGYRLYDREAEERLYLILIFREIGIPLKEIQRILDAPDFDRDRILEEQIRLMQQKIDHLKARTELARGIRMVGIEQLELEGLNVNKFDDYSTQAKALYGKTDAYKEYTNKSAGRSREQETALGGQVMDFFVRLGGLRDQDPGSEAVQAWVTELQAFFTQKDYTCTPQILMCLGESYAAGGSMTENIDEAGGAGTGEFARRAIEIYCSK